MFLTLLMGLMLAGSAITMTMRAAAMPRIDAVERLRRISAYGFIEPETASRSLRDMLDRWAERIGAVVARRTAWVDEESERRTLVSAGIYELTPLTFVGYRVLASVFIPAFVLWGCLSSDSSAALTLLTPIISAAAGWVVPSMLVHRRAARRLEEIELALPELIDLLVVTIEAGLGFTSAMKSAAARVEGPLGEELRLTLQESNLGLSSEEALSNMLERAPTPSMRSFVRSVLQGETLGVSIGTIMRNLAIEMRKRRRASAEERAQKAPVKMMFPLVFLIFPSMFIVLLYPAAASFLEAV